MTTEQRRDAGHAYIASQRAEGWIPVADDYDDPPSRAATWSVRRSSA
jgi:hypothetical protein